MSNEYSEMINRSNEGLSAFRKWHMLVAWFLAISIHYVAGLIK